MAADRPGRAGPSTPTEEISRKRASAGIVPEKRGITHCQEGSSAEKAAFVLRLMNYPRALNYDASWSEWGNRDDTPIAT